MDNKLAMRLGVVAPGDPADVLTWSGVPHYMVEALRPRFREIVYLPAGSLSFSKPGMRLDNWSRRVFGRGYVPGLGPRRLARRARTVDGLIKTKGVDALLGITVAQLVAFLETDVPIVHHSDTTFGVMEGYYPEYSSIWGFCSERGNKYASRTISRAEACTFPSHWAAQSAIDDYGADPQKVHVIPYGANITNPPAAGEVLQAERRRASCQLLFLGRDWQRKGGETVWAAFLELLKRGINARLVVVGCAPGVRHERLEVIPFLNKQVPTDLERYKQLWRESTFLFMPSRQETFGAVFAEAAANALPVISRHTGGIPDAVEEGVSGYLLPEDAEPAAYADVIQETWADREKYQSLMQGARERFERVLNWDAWAERTATLFKPFLRE